MTARPHDRRGFLQGLFAAGTVAATGQTRSSGTPRSSATPPAAAGEYPFLPFYTRAQSYKSLKQSSYDRTGGNGDRWLIAPGGTKEVFAATGPGVITHIWFTIAARSGDHLKELVLRAYWDGNWKPSVEVPIGDFFGLNLGSYQIYQSEYLACSPGRSLNCYFVMPFTSGANLTVTNEGKQEVGAFYSNIDYLTVPKLPDDTLYFHAQYRQSCPLHARPRHGAQAQSDRTGELRLHGDPRPRAPHGRDARRAAERQRLVG